MSDLFDVATEIEDVLIGIERARAAADLSLERLDNDIIELAKETPVTSHISFCASSIRLSTDRIFEEMKKLGQLTESLYAISKGAKR
ncbi:MAG TPA: hypothetical protein DCZ71_04565 [Ruminococcus sp.]|nr:hypothetical protein [Ruminococcus sp.]